MRSGINGIVVKAQPSKPWRYLLRVDMITHCLNLFNTFYGTSAKIVGTEASGDLTLSNGQNLKSFSSESDLIQFLACRTLHLNFVNHKLSHYKAFNLVMIELNAFCGTENIFFNETPNGVVKLWCYDSQGWFLVQEFYDMPAMYVHILSDAGRKAIKEKVNRKTSLFGKVARVFKKK